MDMALDCGIGGREFKPCRFCSVERTNLQLLHKEIVNKKITELNVLYLDRKLILIWNDTNI